MRKVFLKYQQKLLIVWSATHEFIFLKLQLMLYFHSVMIIYAFSSNKFRRWRRGLDKTPWQQTLIYRKRSMLIYICRRCNEKRRLHMNPSVYSKHMQYTVQKSTYFQFGSEKRQFGRRTIHCFFLWL